MPKFVFLHQCYIALRSRLKVVVKVRVKVTGQGQIFGMQRSIVDIRGSTLPSAAMSDNHHYQSKMYVCVSVMSGRLWIIAQMRSIGF